MMISVWRYSHFALAVSSFLLLTLASISGIILAFEPITQKAKGYKIEDFDKVTLAQAIPLLKEKYHGLQELTVDDYDFVIIKWTDQEGKDRKNYVNAVTGEILGVPGEQAAVFKWMTTLHRSLFLHETGRLMVGISAFLLILIALSGIGLVIQRQKGIKRFFSPVERAGFAQYYHVLFGRLALIFILALALTGTYLSVSRFVIKPEKTNLTVDEDAIKEEPERRLADFAVFRQTPLSQVATVQLPFSDFPEDYFTVKLKDREFCVNQFTGDILAQQGYPKTDVLASFSLRWHTGRSSSIWAIVLAITAAYILFFIYSGFAITWKRIRNRSKNKYKAADCRIIILVGSENGSTFQFANSVYRQLMAHGEKVYLTDLNNYQVFPKAAHLIVMTSTYGLGDPPSNAQKFAARLTQYPQTGPVHISVIGFGSRNYEQFCQFANEVDAVLRQQSWALPLMDVVTVNDRSPQDFSHWLTAWQQHTGFHLILSRELLTNDQQGLKKLAVVHKTTAAVDESFLIRLKPARGNKAVSGDLLAIYPKNDHRERLYSIGKVEKEIQLSVKLHGKGLGSGYLHALQTGETIEARIIKNQHFHFPKKANSIILISNGTGIAPFLGMISENREQIPCYLYCGFRAQSSLDLYDALLTESTTSGNLKQYYTAFSREEKKQYVSDLLVRDKNFIWNTLAAGGMLLICGSLAMQKDVMEVLDTICQEKEHTGIAAYLANGQILTDCY